MDIFNAMPGWCGRAGWFGGMGFHFNDIFQILILGMIIFLTIRLFRKNTVTGPSAEDILKQRYASGEIDKDTFRAMKEDLR